MSLGTFHVGEHVLVTNAPPELERATIVAVPKNPEGFYRVKYLVGAAFLHYGQYHGAELRRVAE